MARRTMTIKRVDPWSVLKVGFLANLVLLGILLLAGRVVWFFIDRLELVDKVCEVAGSVGFEGCGLNGGNIFRNALLLGLLGVVVQTGILVFTAFLFNLIGELTGGLTLGVEDDSPARTQAGSSGATPRSAGRTQPAEVVTSRSAPPTAAAGGVAGKVASVAQTAAGAVAGAAATAADAARQAAAKAQAARADAEAAARSQPTSPNPGAPVQPRPAQPQQAQPRPAQPPAQPRPAQPPSPAQPRPAQPGGDPTTAARRSDDLFRPNPEQRPGGSGPAQG